MDQDLRAFIEGMPKVELHMHIEGSLEPEQMFEFARRNHIEIPFNSAEEVRQAYQFSNLQDFLNIYYQGMNVLRTEQDFYDLTMAYLKKAASQNVVHTEIFFDPQGHTVRGVAFETVIGGIGRALYDGKRDLGVSSQMIMCFLRDLSAEDAKRTLEQAAPYVDRIAGIGLDSAEVGHPPEKFAEVFALARDYGFNFAVAHAGEEGPPEYVWQALNVLQVDRIDHGNRAMEDDALISDLSLYGMPLTVCPLSNQKLCVVRDMKQHPLRDMLDMGLAATVNSDDPAYFGGYMNENFTAVAEALDLTRDEVVRLARNAIDASFVSPERAQELRAGLKAYLDQRSLVPAVSELAPEPGL